ncbi:MAG: hypothetical protein GY694_05190 [Gammaproteobacteria bacterium]|nr:hypothetical protein [Gammaproteobacteria bacterium]
MKCLVVIYIPHKALNPEELHKETTRKLGKLYQYDCLRSHNSMAAWGVGYSWIDGSKGKAEKKVSDEQLESAQYKFPINTQDQKKRFFIALSLRKCNPKMMRLYVFYMKSLLPAVLPLYFSEINH